MSVADDFNNKLETTIAIALKESWDENDTGLKDLGYSNPTDGQFTNWARQLVRDRSISFVNPEDPDGDPIRIDLNILQSIISTKPQAQKALKDRFETDELDKIIPTSEQGAKIGEALENAKESSTTLWAMLSNLIMGFIDWLMGGFQSGQDGNLFSGLTEAIARRGAERFAGEANSLLEQGVSDMHPGMRSYIVQEAKKEAERIGGIAPNEPERTLADVSLGEKLAPPSQGAPVASPTQPQVNSTVSLPPTATPATEPEKVIPTASPVATPAAPVKPEPAEVADNSGDQTKLRGVIQNIMRGVLAENKVEGVKMQRTLETATPVVMKVIDKNTHLIENNEFDKLTSEVVQSLWDNKEIQATLITEALETYKTRYIATDERIKNKLKQDIKEQLNPNIRAQLQANIPGKVASANDLYYDVESLGNLSPEASGRLPGGERYI